MKKKNYKIINMKKNYSTIKKEKKNILKKTLRLREKKIKSNSHYKYSIRFKKFFAA